MATKKDQINKVRILADTFISGSPVKAGAIVPNHELANVSQQDMKDLIFHKKAEEVKGQAAETAGKAGR